MIEFFETEAPLKLAQIKEVELLLGLDLPKGYKEHLLKFNGGRCKPNIFNFIEKDNNASSAIDWFLAIYPGKYDNLVRYIEIYKLEKKRLPSDIIPIAHDALGNLVCISCGKNDYGNIYFGDHEQEVDYSISGDDNYSNLFKIAESFEDFLLKLS